MIGLKLPLASAVKTNSVTLSTGPLGFDALLESSSRLTRKLISAPLGLTVAVAARRGRLSRAESLWLGLQARGAPGQPGGQGGLLEGGVTVMVRRGPGKIIINIM